MPQEAVSEKLSSKLTRLILRRLIFIIPTMIITWVIHTYVIVVMNDGFGDSTIWGRWVNTVGNTSSAMVVWGLLAAMIWSLIYSSFKYGPVTAVTGFVKAPFWTYRLITGSGKTGFGAFLMGAGLAAILSSIFQLKASANIILALALSLVGLSQPGFILASLFAKGWMKMTGNLAKNQPDKYALDFRGAHLLVVGLSPGFICAAILSARFAQGFGIIAIIAGIILFFNIQAPRASAGQISGLLLFGSLTALLYALYAWFAEKAFADDGGAKECGNSFQSWSKCQGSGMAVARGAPPALASGAGALAPPLNIIDPSKVPIDIKLAGDDKLSMPEYYLTADKSYAAGGTQEMQFSSARAPEEILADIDRARGYHINPDGSWTAIGYETTNLDRLVYVLKGGQIGCDVMVSTLAQMTGPPGKVVNYGYIWLKNISRDISKSVAEGKPLSEGITQGIFDASVETAVNYGGDQLFTKLGLSGNAPDMSKVSVGNFYKALTGQGTRETTKGSGLKAVKEGGKKAFVWGKAAGAEAPKAAYATARKALMPVVQNSLRQGVIEKGVDVTVTENLQEYGWDAVKDISEGPSGPYNLGGGGNPADQLER